MTDLDPNTESPTTQPPDEADPQAADPTFLAKLTSPTTLRFLRDRSDFELLMAAAMAAGLRNPKESEIVAKIALRAEAVADHYEARGFFTEEPLEAPPVRAADALGPHQVPPPPTPVQPNPFGPPMMLNQPAAKPVIAVGTGQPGEGARGKPVVAVGNGKPGSTYMGKAVVDCSNAPHKKPLPAPTHQSTMRTPPPVPLRPLRGG